jgi:hypothetical protein
MDAAESSGWQNITFLIGRSCITILQKLLSIMIFPTMAIYWGRDFMAATTTTSEYKFSSQSRATVLQRRKPANGQKDWHNEGLYSQYKNTLKYGPPPPMRLGQRIEDTSNRYLSWIWGGRKRPWQNPIDDDLEPFWKDIARRNWEDEQGGARGSGGGSSGGDPPWRDSSPPCRWDQPPTQPGDYGY